MPMTGGVLSILTLTTAGALVLPATSVHVPLTVVPAVSLATVPAGLQVSTPLWTGPLSPALVKDTVTGVVLFHPAALG